MKKKQSKIIKPPKLHFLDVSICKCFPVKRVEFFTYANFYLSFFEPAAIWIYTDEYKIGIFRPIFFLHGEFIIKLGAILLEIRGGKLSQIFQILGY